MTGSPASFDPSADLPVGDPGGGSSGSGSGGGGGARRSSTPPHSFQPPLSAPQAARSLTRCSRRRPPSAATTHPPPDRAWSTASMAAPGRPTPAASSLSSGQRIEGEKRVHQPAGLHRQRLHHADLLPFMCPASQAAARATGPMSPVNQRWSMGSQVDGSSTTLTHGNPNGTTPGGEPFPTGSPNVLSFANQPSRRWRPIKASPWAT